jgi:hypothetical protein
VVQGGLGEELGRALKEAAAPYGIRVVMLRRPDGRSAVNPSVYLGFSGLEDRWLLRVSVEHPRELLDIDLSPVANGARPAVGEEHEDPIFLVCTHALHDACCGRRGPEVARRLAAVRGSQTWEASHVGGDRFAANVVCLPHGFYFGRVTDPERTASLYEAGRIDIPHYRGRSCYEPVVQAAEVMVRNRDSLDGIDDLVPLERIDHGDRESTIIFSTPTGDERSIRLRVERAERRRLTCDATNPGRPRAFFEVTDRAPTE